MKMKLGLAIILLGSSIFRLSAQEVAFNFEDGNKSIWTKATSIYTISKDKAVSGSASLKYNLAELPTNEKENMQVFLGGGEGVKLNAGTYIVSMKFLASENLKGGGFSVTVPKPWTAINFKTNKVEKGKWIDLSQEIVLTEATEKLCITVSANPQWGVTGTFYIDDFKIIKK